VSHSDFFPAPIPEDVTPASQAGQAATRRGWGAGRVAALAIGTLLGLLALALICTGGTALWADRTQRDDGFVTTDLHDFSTPGSALVTADTELGAAGVGWLYGPAVLGKVRIRVTPRDAGSRLFVGIGKSDDVDRYLAGVDRTVISEFFDETVKRIDGAPAVRSTPEAQDFWVASATGVGPQTVLWKPRHGSWSVVVMNADARPALDLEADLGARIPALPWVALGLLLAGALFAAGGALLIVGTVRGDRARPRSVS
jgi:hypothetical protein